MRRVVLAREAGEGDYGVRKRSFRPMLKLALQHSKAGEGDYGVRKRSFRPMLKLALQHSKAGEGNTADKDTALRFAAWGTDALFSPSPPAPLPLYGSGEPRFPPLPPRGRGGHRG